MTDASELSPIDERAIWMAAQMIRDETRLAPHELAHAIIRRLQLNDYIALAPRGDRVANVHDGKGS